jgi:DNA-binding beta-propeller fold protein YncE
MLAMTVFPARGQFVPGHIFVSDFPKEACLGPPYGWDRVWEIDPETGEATLFAELAGEWCGRVTGLAFTPDGTRLRVLQSLASRVLELDSSGNPTVLYDSNNGIVGSYASNAMAFDWNGNFYVSIYRRILRFAPGLDVAEVFADRENDGLGFEAGPIAIGASGDLYFGNSVGVLNIILRFQGAHDGSVFDVFDVRDTIMSLAADSCGNLFANLEIEGQILRYDSEDSSSKQVLVQDYPRFRITAMAVDPSERYLYVAVGVTAEVVRVDVDTGDVSTIVTIPGAHLSRGIAVVPFPGPTHGITRCRQPIPAVSDWGLIVLGLLLLTAAKIRFATKHRESTDW